MEPLEAWRVISASLKNYYQMRRTATFKGYDQTDISAEVMTFQALNEMQKRMDRERSKDNVH